MTTTIPIRLANDSDVDECVVESSCKALNPLVCCLQLDPPFELIPQTSRSHILSASCN